MNNEIYPSRTAIASVLYALTAQGQTFNQLIEKTGLSRKVLRQILSLFLDESTVFINTKGGVEYFYMMEGEFQINPVPPPFVKQTNLSLFGEI